LELPGKWGGHMLRIKDINEISVSGISPRIERKDILDFENLILSIKGSVKELFPLKHSFAEGVYVREIFIPKGSVLTGKIHRHSHPNFIMKGKVVVVTEHAGKEMLAAPMSIISKAGTKRIVFALEDTVWITVHATNETDLEKIEGYVIAPTYDDLLEIDQKERLEIKETGSNL
jgi:hypothetical protein